MPVPAVLPRARTAPSHRLKAIVMALLIGFTGVLSTQDAEGAEHGLVVGANGKAPDGGLARFTFDDATGTLSPKPGSLSTPNPSFVVQHPVGKTLYATNESGLPLAAGGTGSGLSAYALDPANGSIALLNTVELPGGPCHLVVDKSGKYLAAATYGGGNVVVYALLEDGSIGARTALVQHSGRSLLPRRQEAPHAHAVTFSPDQKYLMVADLGLDKVLSYRFDAASGSLQAADPPAWVTKPGAGPRHLVFAQSGYAYVANEIDNTVTAFKVEEASGAGTAIQSLSTLPAGYAGRSNVAEIDLHPSGQWLFVSNRGFDSIAVFRVNFANGLLTLAHIVPVSAKTPRHFTLDPSGKWLLVAGQDSKSVEIYKLDAATGALTLTSKLENLVGKPACLLFLRP